MKKSVLSLFVFVSFAVSAYSQLGVKVGVNMANEMRSYTMSGVSETFSTNNFTGYQVGLVYQLMPKKSGLGCELGLMLSQKGSSYVDSTDVSAVKSGYRQFDYIDLPFNLRYRLSLGFLGVYGSAGIYAGYALSGKTVDEISTSIKSESFQAFTDRVDYGYNLGGGLELFKQVQIGVNWSRGLVKRTDGVLPWSTLPVKSSNHVFSISLVYMFW